MEAKVNLVQKVVLFSKPTVSQSSLPHGQRFTLESLERKKDLLQGRLRGLSEKWQYRVQEQWKDYYSSQQYLIHIVKKKETLTSISRLYGVSVQSISIVNDKIVDINLVFEGQCLNIPSPGVNNARMDQIRKTWFYCIKARDRYQRSLNIWGSVGNHEILTTLSSHRLLPAKTNGYFLLLLPLLVFFISCVISSFRRRVGDKVKNQVISEPGAHHHGPSSIHWKTALSDIRDMEVLGSQSRQDSINPVAEDEVAVSSFEEMSNAYTEMEPAYQKFLSDCGMSESGYWRGGSPSR